MNKENINQIPPQAIDLEEAILGAIMIEQTAIHESFLIIDSQDYFYKDQHKIIYEAILLLYKENRTIDILTVSDILKRMGKLEKAGGYLYITQLSGKASASINIREYCRIIKEMAIRRNMATACVNIFKTSYDISVDVKKLISDAGNVLDKASESFYGESMFNHVDNYLPESIKNLEEREKMMKIGKMSGIPTPIRKLNEKTYGWKAGELTIIAARPSMGKTAFMLSSAVKAAKGGYKVNIYSLEMKGARLMDRIICGESGVDFHKYKSGLVDSNDWKMIEKAVGKLEKLPIYIDDHTAPAMDYIKSRSRINKNMGLCDIVMIDYLQLIDVDRVYGKNREQEVSELSRKAKIIAMEINVPVVLLSQLNRECEQRGGRKRPQLSDLRESGAIEQDADNVLLLYRGEVYDFDKDHDKNGNEFDTKGRGEIIIAKQRDGAVGRVYFGYNESLTRIYDLDIDHKEVPIEQKPDYGLSDDDKLLSA